MRVLVCGGRDYTNRAALWEHLNTQLIVYPALHIICGYDPDDDRYQGADQLAFEWAVEHGVPVFPFPAPWKKYGRPAGPMRNKRMRDWGKPQRVDAFPGGKGTAIMCDLAERAGIRVLSIGV